MRLNRFVFSASLALLGAGVANGANQIDESDSGRIVVTVPIDLIGGEDDIADEWNKAIKKYWNDGPLLGYFKYCGRKVEFAPQVQPFAAGQPGRAGAHKILMRLDRSGQRRRSRVRWGGDFDPSRNSTGTWSSAAPPIIVAHEFGHLLGLEDEYFYEDRNGNNQRDGDEPTRPKPEYRDGSIMAGPGKVLQRHINELMRKNGVAGCEEWAGTIRVKTTAATIVMTMDLNVSLEHDGRGNVTGTMSGEVPFVKTGGISCDAQVVTPGTMSADLTGQYTSTRRSMSLRTNSSRFRQGRYKLICPGYSTTGSYGESGEGGTFRDPVVERVLRNLTVSADGSIHATDSGPLAASPEARIEVELNLRLVEQTDP